MCLRRGFALSPGERVAVVEDVVTTGKSTLETLRLASGLGAKVCAVASILDRSDGEARFGVPFESLMRLSFPTFQADVCPLCRRGEPIDKPGSRPSP
jgi:orotate phosphoribosyltransferase